jgi:A/G-specific adenine glycosylase
MRPDPLDPESLADLRVSLLGHYDRHRRSLPWRGETDPYRILVSEVMLQQTRVDTVLEYYEAWLARFPDVESLARAEPDDVLEAWAGMGYYRRASNLQVAARVVRERPDGALPSTYAVPGVGEYTAGAVASIAFGERVPAADGNVRRVLARLFDVQEPTPTWVRATAARMLDEARPGDWNQALMELGATICTPRSPRCGECPIATWCAARAAGTQLDRPAPARRFSIRRVTLALAVLTSGGRTLLVRRPHGGLLGGMWAFPEREVDGSARAELVAGAAAVAVAAIADELSVPVAGEAEPLPAVDHRFTHLHATYLPFRLETAGPRGLSAPADVAWVDVTVPGRRAVPAAQRRVLESLQARLVRGEPT